MYQLKLTHSMAAHRTPQGQLIMLNHPISSKVIVLQRNNEFTSVSSHTDMFNAAANRAPTHWNTLHMICEARSRRRSKRSSRVGLLVRNRTGPV